VLVDPGSDDIVFPSALAKRIGLDLSQAPQRKSQGVGTSQPVPVLYAPVILVLSDSVQTVRWRATVGFVSVVLRFSCSASREACNFSARHSTGFGKSSLFRMLRCR